MSRGLKAVCVLVLMALSCWPSARGWAAQDAGPLPQVQAELPGNLKLMQDALQKRQAAQLPPGPLKDSNTAVVQTLTDLVQRTTGLQGLLAAGPTPTETSLIVDEWKKIKARMPDAGLTPQEQAGAAAPGGNNQSSPSANTATGKAGGSVPGPGNLAKAPAAGTPSNAAAAPPSTTNAPVDLSKMSFTYMLAVSPIFQSKGPGFQGGCTIGSGAITSDAAVWDVVITLLAKQMDGLNDLGDLVQTDGKSLIVPVISMDQNTTLLIRGRKAYLGRAEQAILAPRFHFRDLSLNEVTDLLQSLKDNNAKIQAALGAATPTMSVYQIPLPEGANPSLTLLSIEQVLFNNNPDMVNHDNLVKQFKANAGTDLNITVQNKNLSVHIPPPVTVAYSTPELSGDSADELSKFAARLANLGAQANINLAKSKNDKDRITHKDEKGNDQPGPGSTGQPLVIENECFKLSFVPGIQNGGISPAANFKGRISYVPQSVPLTLKLSAEGEAASDTAKPRRVSGTGDFAYLTAPFLGGWYVTFGAAGDASYAQMAGIGVTEWRGGGKFELQTPAQSFFFPARGGNDQKPTLTIEAGGVGGNTPNTNTNLIVRGDFVYTLQPSAKIFLDFRAAAAHSDDHRFAGRNDFSFGGFTGRYTIYNDWDFIATYECGRKDPLYVKSCGWQTGFGLKTK
jgi:hypothetical protein